MAHLGNAGNNYDFETFPAPFVNDETALGGKSVNENAFYTGIMWGAADQGTTVINEYHEKERAREPVHAWG